MEKRKRILAEQKKRFEARRMTGGLGDGSVPRKRPVKKSTSKLAALPISGVNKRGTKSRLNPSVDYDAKQKEKDKKKVDRRTGGPGKQRAKGMGVSPGALGGKAKIPSMITPKKRPSSIKPTEKFSSFGAAFRDARKRLGTGKTFTYKGKEYSTVTKAELKGLNLREYLNKLRSKKKGK